MASCADPRRNRVMSAAKVFIFAPVDEARDSHKRLEAEGCELRLGKASWDTPQGNSEPELIRMAQGTHALMGTSIRNVPISRKIMESSPELRVVAKYTIGVDDVDVEAATDMGILVCHGPTESNWGGVAEGTITAMLTMLKRVRERDRHLKDGGTWRDQQLQGTYFGSRADGYAGITIGLIGLGRIGSRIATLLRPWKMRILATDPYVPEAKFVEHGVTRVGLPTLLRESDVVSLHVVLTRETRHMISTKELALMKPAAILINTSRGPCVQEPALVEALLKGQIGGAALEAQLRSLAGRHLVFFAGLPGTGKSLLAHQLAHLAAVAGRGIHLLQWDVARPVFEAAPAGRRYPLADGVTHAVIRKAAGLWVRHAVAGWSERHRGPEPLLVGET